MTSVSACMLVCLRVMRACKRIFVDRVTSEFFGVVVASCQVWMHVCVCVCMYVHGFVYIRVRNSCKGRQTYIHIHINACIHSSTYAAHIRKHLSTRHFVHIFEVVSIPVI